MSGISEFTQSFFDASSKAWKKNKVRYGQAMYKYKKDAFPTQDMFEVLKVSASQKKQLEKELRQRQTIDEYAPPRVRRSPRLRLLHLQKTYSNFGGADDGGDCHRQEEYHLS
jgi:hypothetical protein